MQINCQNTRVWTRNQSYQVGEGSRIGQVVGRIKLWSLILEFSGVDLIDEENMRILEDVENNGIKIIPKFEESNWYIYIFYYLVNLECP